MEGLLYWVESREKGNAAFSNKEYDKAYKEYKKGTELLKNLPKTLQGIITEEQRETLKDFKLKLANNVVLACLKKKEWKEGQEYADLVLSIEPKNPKGLFRRGQCLIELQYYDSAIKNFRECIEADEEMRKECERLIQLCEHKKDVRLKNEKKRYTQVFEKMAEQEEMEEKERKMREKMERKKEREKNMSLEGVGFNSDPKKKSKLENEDGKNIKVNQLLDGTIIDTSGDVRPKVDITCE